MSLGFNVFQAVSNSICQALENGARTVMRDINPMGISGMIGGITLPCRVPQVPTLPDLVVTLYHKIIPDCIETVLNDCFKDFKKYKPTDLWIIDSAFKGFNSHEEAEKYWSKVPGIPFTVIMGDYEHEGEKMKVFIAIMSPHVLPGQLLYVEVFTVYRGDTFLKLYGPTGDTAPDLLSRYKHYKIVESNDRVSLEDDDTPYYEVGE